MPLRGGCLQAATVLAGLAPLSVAACTLCHSDVAAEVRERLFGPDFLSTALSILASLPILLIAVFLAGRDWRRAVPPQ